MPAKKIVAAVALVMATVLGGPLVVGDTLPAQAACSISSALRLGSGGAQVQCLQGTLNAQGYNSGPVDGRFGGMTYRAVVRYQQAKRLVVDGIVGRQTGTALGIWGTAAAGGSAGGAGSGPGTATGGMSGCAIDTLLRRGSSGAQVRCVQSRLTSLGYPAGPIDGAFGTMTHNGVVRYQRAKGLLADGVVGRITGTSLGIWGATASGASGGSSTTGQCTPPSGVPASARQVVVVNSSSSRADVDLLVQSGGRWTCAGRHARPGRAQRRAPPGQPSIG